MLTLLRAVVASVRSDLRVCDGVLVRGLQLPYALSVLPEVSLAANQNDRGVPTEVSNLREPLGRRHGSAFVLGHTHCRAVRVVSICALFSGTTGELFAGGRRRGQGPRAVS